MVQLRQYICWIIYIIKNHRRNIKSLNIAFVDIAFVAAINIAFVEAFDSVKHEYLWECLRKKGLPPTLINYLIGYYTSTRTALCLRGNAIKWIHPTRGVKQGDPMSPVLFSIVMESILNKLDRGIGIELYGNVVNHIAYADDVVLLARTTSGLQYLINVFDLLASKANLNINVEKTKVFSIIVHGKVKKVSVKEPKIKFHNNLLPVLDLSSSVKYMGIFFNTYGIEKAELLSELNILLDKLILMLNRSRSYFS